MVEVLETWVGPKPTMMTTLRGGPQIATRRVSGRKSTGQTPGGPGGREMRTLAVL